MNISSANVTFIISRFSAFGKKIETIYFSADKEKFFCPISVFLSKILEKTRAFLYNMNRR